MPIHAEKRMLPYRPDQMFALVAAVDRYPEFLPWCVAARIRSREAQPGPHPKTQMLADLLIGFRMIRERYSSRVTLDPPRRIDVTCAEGPFRDLKSHWTFEPATRSAERSTGGTVLNFYIDFEFRSKLLQSLIGEVFNDAVRRMVAAFEGRAKQLYGTTGRVSS